MEGREASGPEYSKASGGLLPVEAGGKHRDAEEHPVQADVISKADTARLQRPLGNTRRETKRTIAIGKERKLVC